MMEIYACGAGAVVKLVGVSETERTRIGLHHTQSAILCWSVMRMFTLGPSDQVMHKKIQGHTRTAGTTSHYIGHGSDAILLTEY